MPILDEVALDISLAGPIETEALNLAAAREELARLRYMVILTARWQSSDNVDPERRAQLGADLEQLRANYSQKIDEIAMTMSIQQAMDAKEHVERSVTVPRGAKLPGGSFEMADYDL